VIKLQFDRTQNRTCLHRETWRRSTSFDENDTW